VIFRVNRVNRVNRDFDFQGWGWGLGWMRLAEKGGAENGNPYSPYSPYSPKKSPYSPKKIEDDTKAHLGVDGNTWQL
jgi:hypothetical protein